MMRKYARKVDGAARLKPVEMLVLLTLLTDRPQRPGVVTDRLLTKGLIKQTLRPQLDQETRLKRRYRVTPYGRRLLGAEAGRLRKFLLRVEALDLVEDGLLGNAAGF